MVSDGYRSLEAITELDCEPNLPIAEGAKCKVLRTIDGDTILIGHWREDCDYPVKTSVRLNGYDSAEIHSKNLQEKQMGFVAKQRLEEVLLGKIVTMRNVSTCKFGRILCDISTDTIPSIVEYMLQDKNTCKPYDGGKKSSWHFTEQALAAAPPIPPPQKRQLSPKRSPKRPIVTMTKTVETKIVTELDLNK